MRISKNNKPTEVKASTANMPEPTVDNVLKLIEDKKILFKNNVAYWNKGKAVLPKEYRDCIAQTKYAHWITDWDCDQAEKFGDRAYYDYDGESEVSACGDVKASTVNTDAIKYIKAAIDVLGKSGNKDAVTKDSIANLATVMFDIKANTVTASDDANSKDCKVTECSIDRVPNHEPWVEGVVTLKLNASNPKSRSTVKYSYEAKVFDDPSEYGIKNGRVSKLWIKNNSTKDTVCNYDRGWDVKPSDAQSKAVYKYLIKYLEGIDKLYSEEED